MSLKDQLEQLIDKNGIRGVLSALSEVCYEKRDHILEAWQDKPLACEWGKLAARIERASELMSPLPGE